MSKLKQKRKRGVILTPEGLQKLEQARCESEYQENFGDNTVPYQRRRIIAQRTRGEIPFNLKTPRMGQEFLNKQGMPQLLWAGPVRKFRPQEQTPKAGDPALFLTMVNDVSPILIST